MHRFPLFGQQMPLFFYATCCRAHIIRGYIPKGNCKGLLLKDVHKRETFFTPINIYTYNS